MLQSLKGQHQGMGIGANCLLHLAWDLHVFSTLTVMELHGAPDIAKKMPRQSPVLKELTVHCGGKESYPRDYGKMSSDRCKLGVLCG